MKKILACLLLLSFLPSAYAGKPGTFLRLYNINGNKIASGYLSATTDSSIILVNGKERTEILSSQIGIIKTHHIVNRILKFALAMLIILAVIALLVFLIWAMFKSSSKNPPSNIDFSNAGGTGKVHKTVKAPGVPEQFKIDNNAGGWPVQRALLDRLLQD